jgi:hypothetical protein
MGQGLVSKIHESNTRNELCGSRPSYTQHIYWYYYITLIVVYHSASTCFELSGSSSGTYQTITKTAWLANIS